MRLNSARCALAVNAIVRHWCAMAREDPHFRLRIPEDLKRRIEDAALENRRSITAEITARLEASFAAAPEPVPVLTPEIFDKLFGRLAIIEQKIDDSSNSERLPSFIRKEPEAPEAKGGVRRARILSKDFLHAPPKRDDID
ncbi:MAG: Arc family DNA-binding protein [Candidatus Polarisedimenticolia bacterium]